MYRGLIYKYTNIINGKVYIGQTTNEFKRRQKWHSLNSPYAGNHINNARAKYSIASFVYEVLEEVIRDSKHSLAEELNSLERKYIAIYNSKNPKYGYNLSDGGLNGTGQVITDETRKRMSAAQKGIKKPMSDIGRRNISLSHRSPRPWACKKVCQYDKDTGELIKVWNSLKEAANFFGDKSVGNLVSTIAGKYRRKYYKGFKWKYYESQAT